MELVGKPFQQHQKNIKVPSVVTEKINHINLSVDFEAVLPNSVFKILPHSIVCECDDSSKICGTVETHSSKSLTWNASIKQEKKEESILMKWELVSGFPEDKDIYIFGYGSLLSKKQIELTNTDFDINSELIPVYLQGYMRDFSAITKNVNAFRISENNIPKYISCMNISKSDEDKAYGVLFKVDKDNLGKFDERESSYIRIDVTEKVKDLEGDHIFKSKSNNNDIRQTEVRKDFVIFTYISINSLDEEDFIDDPAIGKVYPAIGKDYIERIKEASATLDKPLKRDVFSNAFERDYRDYKKMPLTELSNSRPGQTYKS